MVGLFFMIFFCESRFACFFCESHSSMTTPINYSKRTNVLSLSTSRACNGSMGPPRLPHVLIEWHWSSCPWRSSTVPTAQRPLQRGRCGRWASWPSTKTRSVKGNGLGGWKANADQERCQTACRGKVISSWRRNWFHTPPAPPTLPSRRREVFCFVAYVVKTCKHT